MGKHYDKIKKEISNINPKVGELLTIAEENGELSMAEAITMLVATSETFEDFAKAFRKYLIERREHYHHE